MRAALVAAALALITMSGGATVAQEGAVVRETRCWLGSVTFSSGAAMDVGDRIATCDGENGWRTAEPAAEASGCLLEGKLSSVGAVVGISNNDQFSLQCGASGRWTTLAATEG